MPEDQTWHHVRTAHRQNHANVIVDAGFVTAYWDHNGRRNRGEFPLQCFSLDTQGEQQIVEQVWDLTGADIVLRDFRSSGNPYGIRNECYQHRVISQQWWRSARTRDLHRQLLADGNTLMDAGEDIPLRIAATYLTERLIRTKAEGLSLYRPPESLTISIGKHTVEVTFPELLHDARTYADHVEHMGYRVNNSGHVHRAYQHLMHREPQEAPGPRMFHRK